MLPEGLSVWLTIALMIGILALVVTALIFAIGSKNWSTGQSLLWVLLILFLPVLGSITFFVVDGMRDRDRKAARV